MSVDPSTPPTVRTVGAVAGVAGLVVAGALFGTGVASAETAVPEPATFTSAFTTMATPDQVVNADSVRTPGQAGAAGTFTFRVNSDMDIICYDISLTGVSGDYMSPAKTATHIHQAAAGKAGPPRIAFPNPTPVGDGPRTSSGCLKGPFTTGIVTNGADTGAGFTLAALEADPAAFAADSHTVTSPAGVVRGQLTRIPVGGVDTGAGGSAVSTEAAASDARGGSTGAVVSLAAVGAAAVVGAAVVVRRRSAARS